VADRGGPRPTCQATLAQRPGRPWPCLHARLAGRPHWRRRRGTREDGERSYGTGGSSGRHLRGQLGRRRTGGDEFDGGERGHLRGNDEWRRRFRPPRADSVEGEEEGGEGDLQGTPGKLREAQNGGGRRRPWRRLRARAEEKSRRRGSSRGGKRKRERERRRKGGLIPSSGSGGGTHPYGDQATVSRPPCCFQLEEEDNVHFARNPLDFWRFSVNFKTEQFLH
jgi:hypothetical protein